MTLKRMVQSSGDVYTKNSNHILGFLALVGMIQLPLQQLGGLNAVHFGLRYSIVMELIFEVRDADESGYCARALGHSIFTEADTWEELRSNVLEATSLHFEDSLVHPRLVQLHYVKDELIPVEAA